MIRKNTFLLVLTLCSNSVIHTFAQTSLTLHQAIDTALKRNLQFKEHILNINLSELAVQEAANNILPNLILSPQGSFNWGRTLDVSTYNYTTQRVFLSGASLESQFTLFRGGYLKNEILKNKKLLDANKYQLEQIRNEVILQTVTVFLQTLATEDMLKVAHNQVELAQLFLNNLRKEYKAGKKSLADVALNQAQLANIEFDEATVLNQHQVNKLNLTKILNLSESNFSLIRPVLPNKDSLDLDTSNLTAQAIAYNPSIKATKSISIASQYNVAMAKSQYLPSISVFASAGSNYSDARYLTQSSSRISIDTIGFLSGSNQAVIAPYYQSVARKYSFFKQMSDNFYQSIGLSIQVPIFNRFNTRVNLKKAKIEKLKSDIAIEQQTNIVVQTIKQAVVDFESARQKLKILERNYSALNQVMLLSQKRYKSGISNMLDLNIAITNFNKVEYNVIQAKYDVIFKRNVIDFYLGKPLGF